MFSSLAIPIGILYTHWWAFGGLSGEDRVVTAATAIHEARKIQPMLQKSHKCLSSLAGWSRHEKYFHGELAKEVSETGDWLTFDCDQNARKFWVTIRYGFDDVAGVSGHFDGPLTITYGHPSAQESKVIPPQADTRALAELIASGGR